MKRIFGSEKFPSDASSPVVALGNFDGVHLGHRRIIERAKEIASPIPGSCVVYTFDPHPVKVLAPAECPPLLQTMEQRLESLEEQGVDLCVVEPFTQEVAARKAEEFFREIIEKRLRAKAVVVGYDFTFGMRRQGTVEMLGELGKSSGIQVEILKAQFLGEKLISSTNIRRLIEHGDVSEAGRLLSRPYVIEGVVIPGRGVGASLAARTANIDTHNECIPANGVYLTEARVGSRRYPSVTSIGDNPTFPHAPFAVEAHLIDEAVDVMGQKISLAFLNRMREQIAFASTGELKEQIRLDIDAARRMHRECGGRGQRP